MGSIKIQTQIKPKGGRAAVIGVVLLELDYVSYLCIGAVQWTSRALYLSYDLDQSYLAGSIHITVEILCMQGIWPL